MKIKIVHWPTLYVSVGEGVHGWLEDIGRWDAQNKTWIYYAYSTIRNKYGDEKDYHEEED